MRMINHTLLLINFIIPEETVMQWETLPIKIHINTQNPTVTCHMILFSVPIVAGTNELLNLFVLRLDRANLRSDGSVSNLQLRWAQTATMAYADLQIWHILVILQIWTVMITFHWWLCLAEIHLMSLQMWSNLRARGEPIHLWWNVATEHILMLYVSESLLKS